MKSKKYLIALILIIIIIFLFEIMPIVSIVIKSFSPRGELGFTLEHFIRIFTKDLYTQSIINSLWISIMSALIGIVIAFLGAKAAHNSHSRLRGFFVNVLNITSNFAGIPLAFAFIILLGNVGVLTLFGKQFGIEFLANFDVYSINGLMLTYIYFQIPLATLLLLPTFDGLKREWKEAVTLLGGNSLVYWFKVAIPNMLPSLLGTLSVLFANALTAYATGYALLSSNAMLLPVRISEQFVGDVLPNQEFGSALAVILMGLMIMATLLTNYLQKRSQGGIRS